MRTLTLALLVTVGCGSSAQESDVSLDGSGGTQATVDAATASGGQSGNARPDAGRGGSGGTKGTGGASMTGGAPGTGGAVGTGGATGTGGGAPHVVEPCPTGSGSPGQVGVWEDITPAAIRNGGAYTPTGAILVNPKDSRIVYGGSEGQGLFKSTDCGASFVHVSTGTNGSHISSGRMWDMVIDPVNPEILYTVEGYGDGGLWKTTNGGVDWINTTPSDSNVGQAANGNFTSIVGMDVTDPAHLLLAFHSGCSGAYAPQCMAESKDGGATWRLFKTPMGGEGVGVMVLGPTTWLNNGYNDLEETTDGGATWFKASGTSAHWQLYQSPTSGAFYIGTQQGIIKSTNGKDWSLLAGFTNAAQGITGDGTYIYAGQQWGSGLFKIPEDNPAGYTSLPKANGSGAYFMSVDRDHHILYASEMQHFYRLLTE